MLIARWSNILNIGLIGYGMIGRVHALAYREIPFYYPQALPALQLAAVCTRTSDSAAHAAQELPGVQVYSDPAALITDSHLDIVDICTPNDSHRDLILAALKADKPVLVDKPLARTLAEALEIEQASRATERPVGLVFNYRFVPAIQRARELIQEGALGRIYQFTFEYAHSGYQDPERPMSWRLRQKNAGGGALVDLGSHIIDLLHYLLGPVASVSAITTTFVPQRPTARGSPQHEDVDVDDAAWLQARLENGALGTLAASRFATGAADDLSWRIHGEKAALRFSLQDANVLEYFDGQAPADPLGGRRGWTRIETYSRYPRAQTPPARATLGWNRTHAENIFAFLEAVHQGRAPEPGVSDGVEVHRVLDAAYKSARAGTWVNLR